MRNVCVDGRWQRATSVGTFERGAEHADAEELGAVDAAGRQVGAFQVAPRQVGALQVAAVHARVLEPIPFPDQFHSIPNRRPLLG